VPEEIAVAGVFYSLMHVPDLVRFGSKPARELKANPALAARLKGGLRCFEDALAYAPHQVFIGALEPEKLPEIARPWYANPVRGARARGRFGEIGDEEAFYSLLGEADRFGLVSFERSWVEERASSGRLKGESTAEIERRLRGGALPLLAGGRLIGCLESAHEEDGNLAAAVLLENLAAKASAAHALRGLLAQLGREPAEIDYVISCSEEAVGDRYNRGGGNLAKAIAEMSGCANAAGADVKAFCAGPLYAIVHGASLVRAGLFRNVAVVGGGSLAKLGMKFSAHLNNDMPVLEDVLAGFAVLLAPGNGKDPCIRLDSVGFHPVRAGSSPQEMAEALIEEPLKRLGKRFTDIDRYAVELHNPEITVPAGSGDVPRANYRTLAALAVLRGEIARDGMEDFVRRRGMIGYAPTQGHIPSAVSYLGHAREALLAGGIRNAMLVSKGSLFLGRMTQLSDGCSFLVEPPGARGGRC
jgi:hypothetical protein